MKKLGLYFIALLILSACQNQKNSEENQNNEEMKISTQTIDNTIKELKEKFGETHAFRIVKGVNQVANLWQKTDGNEEDFKNFCLENFINNETELRLAFEKISKNFEIINGHFNKMTVLLKEPLHLNTGEITTLDEKFGAYNISAHLEEDFYKNKIAFIIALNFPSYNLTEKSEHADSWNREQWAYSRIGDIYTSRAPSHLYQEMSETMTKADNYISNYYIYMGNLVNDEQKALFPEDLKLISHWGLRDELKSNYITENGLEKQKMIYEVMMHIIDQSIPAEMINKNDFQWNPYTNILYKGNEKADFNPEPNTRYQTLLDNFHAMKKFDPYNPLYPTYIQRKFDEEMEISQQEVEKIFTDFVSSPVVRQVGELISERLGRPLEPFDIWYNGFKSGNSMTEEELDKVVEAKYPNVLAYENDIPNILMKLGFTEEKANYIASKIQVDAARGAGHAWGAEMKEDKARLRTHIAGEGMDYKGYNIATHELGHNVEQTISLQDVDYYVLNGVPNTAFTEALAFVFQKRDLMLLGLENQDPNAEHLMALDVFWSAYEIMGVSLVDMNVWKWMYENPDCTAEELKAAVIDIAKDVWNKYYAPVFGQKDVPILAIYSHMIDYPLYLSAYPIGNLIEFQLEKQLAGKNFAEEVERIFAIGRIIPQSWMMDAVGRELSGEPLIEAAKEAINHVK
jgi:hypothetical protein